MSSKQAHASIAADIHLVFVCLVLVMGLCFDSVLIGMLNAAMVLNTWMFHVGFYHTALLNLHKYYPQTGEHYSEGSQPTKYLMLEFPDAMFPSYPYLFSSRPVMRLLYQ